MAYVNPFSYNRDSSFDSKYKYVADLSKFKPIYGSSVSFSSRLNYLQTVDNALKILPASENNLVVKYNLKFILTDDDAGSLLKTIEIAGGYKYLKFTDPDSFYKDIIGLVEDYSINKSHKNLNELNIIISSYFKSPMFNWKTSSFFNHPFLPWNTSLSYKKYDFVYYASGETQNKIDNFWFAKEDINPLSYFDKALWTKSFIHEPKLPFELNNKFDIYQLDYKNSFIQNIKHKENSNALKRYSVKFENISRMQCLSILLFLEKKCGYRRFVYDFPFLLKKAKVFICTEWTHVLKYKDCNDITATFIEDPNPDISNLAIASVYDGFNFINTPTIPAVFPPTPIVEANKPPTIPDTPGVPPPPPPPTPPPPPPPTVVSKEGFLNGVLYEDLETLTVFNTKIIPKIFTDNFYYIKGLLANGTYSPITFSTVEVRKNQYFINGKLGEGNWIHPSPDPKSVAILWGMKFKDDGNPLFTTTANISANPNSPAPLGLMMLFSTTDLALKKYEGIYVHGCKYDTIVTGPAVEIVNENRVATNNKILYLNDGKLYNYQNGELKAWTGAFRNLFFVNGFLGNLSRTAANKYQPLVDAPYGYTLGYPIPGSAEIAQIKANVGLALLQQVLYSDNKLSVGYILHNGILYFNGKRYTGIYEDKYYFMGVLTTGCPTEPRKRDTFFYINGIKLIGSDVGVTNPADKHWYQYGLKIISNGYYNGSLYINGVKQN